MNKNPFVLKGGLAFIAITGVFVLLAACWGCKTCPPCPPAAFINGTGPVIFLSGVVLEEFNPGPVSAGAGDSVLYTSGIYSLSDVANIKGKFGVDTSFWDANSIIYYLAYKNNHGSFDEIIYNKLGQPPYNDLMNDTFILTTPDTTAIPVIIFAQQGNRTGYSGATVQIKDGSLHNVGSAATTNSSGVCNYGTGLKPNSVYWLYVSGPMGRATHFQFSTAAPGDVVTGTICRLRIFARY